MKYQIPADTTQEILIEKPGEYTVELVGAGAEAHIFGAFTAEKKEQVEVTVIIHHKAPHTRANTTLRGVGRDQSLVKFVGRIIIDEDCGDSNSFLTLNLRLVYQPIWLGNVVVAYKL